MRWSFPKASERSAAVGRSRRFDPNACGKSISTDRSRKGRHSDRRCMYARAKVVDAFTMIDQRQEKKKKMLGVGVWSSSE
jgi:hypothetical protein